MNEQNVILEEDRFEEEIDVLEEMSVTLAMWGDITGNIENQTDLQNALDAKQDSLSQAQLDATNSGITSEKVAKYDGYEATINAKADQSALDAESIARGEADAALGTRIDNEVTARQTADNGLQSQIDAITSKSDVVDVVANYAALQNYDTSALGNNDVVKVLDDETHEDALTYYRWNATTRTWSYIGQEAPYYSKGQMDVFLQGKQDKLTAGNNVQIQNNVISATDTTYAAGNGLNLNGTEFSADTDVLATKEDLDDYYTKSEADTLIEPKLEVEVVDQLPTTGEESKLYLTPKAHTEQTASGNPINLNITEGAGKLDSVQIDGDTFQQSYTGKNLARILDGEYSYSQAGQSWNISGGEIIASRITPDYQGGSLDLVTGNVGQYATATSGNTRLTPNGGTYTLTVSRDGEIVKQTGQPTRVGVYLYKIDSSDSKTNLGVVDISESTSNSITVTLGADEYLCAMVFYSQYATYENAVFRVQIESGSTATSFEPYVGGVPSPNPDYPQAIQTVTGLQTVSINGTDYPIDLGDIELCGLGDDGSGNPLYRDYIYPDGDEWKVHKLNKRIIFNSQSVFRKMQNGTNAYGSTVTDMTTVRSSVCVLSDKFTGVSYDNRATSTKNIVFLDSNYTDVNSRVIVVRNTEWSNLTAFNAWLANNNIECVYTLNTPTDTTITDQTLIAQLEAVANARLASGSNTITNSATGDNLAGDLEVSYHGFDPRNRYDKWLWLDINNEYEQLGS